MSYLHTQHVAEYSAELVTTLLTVCKSSVTNSAVAVTYYFVTSYRYSYIRKNVTSYKVYFVESKEVSPGHSSITCILHFHDSVHFS